VQKEDLRIWRALMWVIGVLTLIVALLTAIAQLGEAIMRVLKAWQPFLF
jgi:hypothetical protein